jgi:hypothetical protein
VSTRRMIVLLSAGFLVSLILPPIYALESATDKKLKLSEDAVKLVGVWEIARTKEPNMPYRDGYKGRPFVSKGANAFTLIMEYRKDGTFRRLSRKGSAETIQDGHWILSGHELRHKRSKSKDEEVMYLRFDKPNQFTSIEVYEDTPDPGLFAQFHKIK